MSDTENHEIGALRAQLTETLIFNDQVNAFEQIFIISAFIEYLVVTMLQFPTQLKAVVLMLDEKVQDAEHTLLTVKEVSQEEKELVAAKVDELTTALQNLKWGFKERQESIIQ